MVRARLLAVSGPAEGREFELDTQEFAIGREESNHLFLADVTVSRRHCVIRGTASGFQMNDLGSANRTLVNGHPGTEVTLRHGDCIQVGKSKLIFLNGEDTIDAADVDGITADSTVVLPGDQTRYLKPDRLLDGAAGSQQLAAHIKSLLRAASAIALAAGTAALGQALLSALADAIPMQRGALALEDEIVCCWNRSRVSDPAFQPPRNVLRRVLDEGVAVCLNGILNSPDEFSGSVCLARINSILAAPIPAAQGRLAVLYVDSLDPSVRMTEDDLQLVAGVAALASAPLANLLRVRRLEAEKRRLEEELIGGGGMVGDSPKARELYRFIHRAAPSGSTVLIYGESGTGKELAARAIHENSARSTGPFVAINCAAITETLLESEFFGHERGAFTGAVSQKTGKLEDGNGGTVFLDEIGELAPILQAKLLRVLQEREFERVGGNTVIRVDIRLVAATNRDLADMVKRGLFRQDLFYRLNVVSTTLPPLRERRADVLLLARHFLELHRGRATRLISGFSRQAETCLTNYDWPGNIRELQNAVEHAVVLGTTPEILPEDLPDSVVETGDVSPGGKFHETIRDFKRQLVTRAMHDSNQNYTDAAKILGLHPNNLHRLMKTLGLK